MSIPFFTILLPAYNAAKHIGNALNDLMTQSCVDYEIIVVDDGSSDGTGDLVKAIKDPRIRLITLPSNTGLVGALNAGLSEARGSWIARQDADDRCRQDRLEMQRDLILQNPSAVLFYSRATLIDQRGWLRGKMRPPLSDHDLRWDLCFHNSIPHTSAVFPTTLVRDKLKGYAGDNVTADFDLWSRLLRKGSAVGDGNCLVSYRNHSESIMGREHVAAAKRSDAGLATIIRNNLKEWTGASDREADLIVTAWIDPVNARWEEYFLIREKLVSCELNPTSSVVAEEDYTLMHRASCISKECVSAMLRSMKLAVPERYRSLPVLRTLLARTRGGF